MPGVEEANKELYDTGEGLSPAERECIYIIDWVDQHLNQYDQGTKMAWCVLYLLKGMNVELSTAFQCRLLHVTKLLYKCLKND